MASSTSFHPPSRQLQLPHLLAGWAGLNAQCVTAYSSLFNCPSTLHLFFKHSLPAHPQYGRFVPVFLPKATVRLHAPSKAATMVRPRQNSATGSLGTIVANSDPSRNGKASLRHLLNSESDSKSTGALICTQNGASSPYPDIRFAVYQFGRSSHAPHPVKERSAKGTTSVLTDNTPACLSAPQSGPPASGERIQATDWLRAAPDPPPSLSPTLPVQDAGAVAQDGRVYGGSILNDDDRPKVSLPSHSNPSKYQ